METTNYNSTYIIAGAIVAAGLIVAVAVYYGGGDGASEASVADSEADGAPAENITPITSDDHILGNPEAPVIIVEFSDLECPFCKRFHGTMKQVIDTYGEDGKVAWVYRHFPLTSLHPKAQKEAEATECAAELGGQLGFWNYTDRLFEITPSNNGLDLDLLPQIAEDVGLDREAFEECLESGRHKDRVQRDRDDAISAGGRGTPFSILLTKDGEATPIPGAVSFDTIKGMIDAALPDQQP